MPIRALLRIGEGKQHNPLPPKSNFQSGGHMFSSQSSHLSFAGKSTTNFCPSTVIHLNFCQQVKAFFPQKKTPRRHHLLLTLKIISAQHYF